MKKAQARKTPWVSVAGKSVSPELSQEKPSLVLAAILKKQRTHAEAHNSSRYLQFTKHFYIHCPI